MTLSYVLLLIAGFFQMLGSSSTCTQGADGTFISGAILSMPLLLVVAVCLLRMPISRSLGSRVGYIGLALLTVTLLAATSSIWLNLLRFGTPCGEEHAWMGGSQPSTQALILGGYLLLPLFIAALSCWQAWRSASATKAAK
jgi:hypothetical protein